MAIAVFALQLGKSTMAKSEPMVAAAFFMATGWSMVGILATHA
jgi:hypothetical protein